MLGPSFDSQDEGFYIQLAFYWFAITFFKRWDPDVRYGDGSRIPWTGFVFYYKPNPSLKEGDLIWLRCKKWMWPDHPRVIQE
jgi:hypothetical protein